MPVVSPSQYSSSITGTYRSTLSTNSSLDKPYYRSTSGTYVTSTIRSPYGDRTTEYRTRISDIDGKRERKSSIVEYSRNSRAPSGDSDSGISTRYRSDRSESRSRDISTTRSESGKTTDRAARQKALNSAALAMSTADLYNKYSPANYIPLTQRLQAAQASHYGDIARSKSISSDIGRPPAADGTRLRKARNSTANTIVERPERRYKDTSPTPSYLKRSSITNGITDKDRNGNDVPSVSEIRKRFDTKMAVTKLPVNETSSRKSSVEQYLSQLRDCDNSEGYKKIKQEDKPVPVHLPYDKNGLNKWETSSSRSNSNSDISSKTVSETVSLKPKPNNISVTLTAKLPSERLASIKSQLDPNNPIGKILEKSTVIQADNGETKRCSPDKKYENGDVKQYNFKIDSEKRFSPDKKIKNCMKGDSKTYIMNKMFETLDSKYGSDDNKADNGDSKCLSSDKKIANDSKTYKSIKKLDNGESKRFSPDKNIDNVSKTNKSGEKLENGEGKRFSLDKNIDTVSKTYNLDKKLDNGETNRISPAKNIDNDSKTYKLDKKLDNDEPNRISPDSKIDKDSKTSKLDNKLENSDNKSTGKKVETTKTHKLKLENSTTKRISPGKKTEDTKTKLDSKLENGDRKRNSPEVKLVNGDAKRYSPDIKLEIDNKRSSLEKKLENGEKRFSPDRKLENGVRTTPDKTDKQSEIENQVKPARQSNFASYIQNSTPISSSSTRSNSKETEINIDENNQKECEPTKISIKYIDAEDEKETNDDDLVDEVESPTATGFENKTFEHDNYLKKRSETKENETDADEGIKAMETSTESARSEGSSSPELTSRRKILNAEEIEEIKAELAGGRSGPSGLRRSSERSDTSTETRLERKSANSSGLNGLRNIGNTCFMNSVLQCLSNTKPLLEYVVRGGYCTEINESLSCMGGALIKAFASLIKELWREGEKDSVVNTTSFKSAVQRFAPRFMGYSQQDAQEFLRYLLEGMHEDVNRVTVKPKPILTEIDDTLSDSAKAAEAWARYMRMENSHVSDIFVGQLKSTLRCTHCHHDSVTFDPFWDLSLPIPSRTGNLKLQQCLQHFTKEEEMDGDEKPTCSKCGVRRKCLKWFTVQKFPQVLVLHLKRFSPTERFRGKLNVVVEFPLNGLDMSPYAATRGPSVTYNLYAVSNHSGTTYSGHYTAYCKHPYTGDWHEYNDSRVSPISPRNVVSSEAYVLFYEMARGSSS